ncbi:alkene reductase [Yinghuangia sp. ASG 101]|uniref:alkene reductase n=1 Tax=Yinghuangia sp. ASG 101 TaxID=2896848 RepID=UPI001E4191E5|nr:alkene reductase [Yinghuangia sp. ASG 101]UGQ14312.1 alkene reductase [Yinghuangia sp. ASG 101]
MPSLLTPYQGRTLDLRNRIVMAPMTRGRADDATGVPNPLAPTYYRQRAGAGLIVSEGVAISPIAKGGPGVPGLHTDEQRRGWRPVTDAVHDAGGTIYAQLWHVGRMSHPAILRGDTPVAPSAVRIENDRIYTADGMLDHVLPRALTTDEVQETVRDFARAAEAAIAAGFDGVEIHGANGYLIHQFLADNTNLRGDAYGGSTNGRLRFAVEIVEAVTAAVGAERVGLRVSPDNTENELAETDPAGTYRALAAAVDPLGLSYLHVLQRGGYEAVTDLRAVWSGTLIANRTGKTPSTPEAGARLLADGHADLIALGRLFITNPDLPARIAAGVALAEPARQNVYGGGAEGYVDYPAADAEPVSPQTTN